MMGLGGKSIIHSGGISLTAAGVAAEIKDKYGWKRVSCLFCFTRRPKRLVSEANGRPAGCCERLLKRNENRELEMKSLSGKGAKLWLFTEN